MWAEGARQTDALDLFDGPLVTEVSEGAKRHELTKQTVVLNHVVLLLGRVCGEDALNLLEIVTVVVFGKVNRFRHFAVVVKLLVAENGFAITCESRQRRKLVQRSRSLVTEHYLPVFATYTVPSRINSTQAQQPLTATE